jgi:hypothetical protein
MDFDPWLLFSGVLIGLIGTGIFIHGKKEANLKCLGAGVALCVFPYFVHSIILMWVITAGCLGGLYALRD